MRLKSADGPISIHNVNDVLNSPKRINTLQNSNITANLTSNSNLSLINTIENDERLTKLSTDGIRNLDTLNNVQNEQVKVQWCNPARDKQRELSNNVNNQQRNHLSNINNTLAASLRNTSNARRAKAASIYSESSPDDSLLDYEEVHQSASSADTSPQDEDRGFDVSDSESLSDDGNLNRRPRQKTVLQRRGIVNPNYPGFQHFAHTLDYTIKVSSDTDFTDDDYECELVGTENRTKFAEKNDDFNNINNNNVEETDDCQIDKIDSVNRLDSVENIQKVFYDKPVLNLDCENLNQNFSDLESSSNNSNQASDEDTAEKLPFQKIEVKLNIRAEEVTYKPKDLNEEIQDGTQELSENILVKPQDFSELSSQNIVGDFGKEVEDELGRIASENIVIQHGSVNLESLKFDFEINFEPSWERAVVQEIEEAIGKLTELLDFEPTAHKYEIEPNTEEPFSKLSPSKQNSTHLFDTELDLEENINEAVIAEDLDDIRVEEPAEFLDFEPIAQTFKLEEKLEEALNNLSSCEKSCPVILQDSEVIQTNMALIQNYKQEEELITNAESAISVTETKNKTRNFEKMEVESEINELKRDSNRQLEEIECQIKKMKSDTTLSPKSEEEVEKFCKEDVTKDLKEKEEDTGSKKKEKTDYVVRRRRDYSQQFGSLIQFPRKDGGGKQAANRKSVPAAKEKKKSSSDHFGSFDVYNIETAMPKIDLEAIELHLRAAREEERRRRTDREEIRRRLAMGPEDDYYSDRPGRKPSLQSRLQSGMNLQICFMNEALSDTESPSSDSECPLTNPKLPKAPSKNIKEEKSSLPPQRPSTLSIGEPLLHQPHHDPAVETDFFTKQARLQTEARMALAQAKEMARMQMEIEKQKQKKSPITEMVRHSLEKVGIPFPEDKRRLSRQILTEMNVAQLQVIVNDLHTQIETLNEHLVKFLMDRDDLHMEQDSMLVDIEDLTRYLGAKEQILKEQSGFTPTTNNNVSPPSPAPPSPLTALNNSMKPHLHRIASLVKK